MLSIQSFASALGLAAGFPPKASQPSCNLPASKKRCRACLGREKNIEKTIHVHNRKAEKRNVLKQARAMLTNCDQEHLEGGLFNKTNETAGTEPPFLALSALASHFPNQPSFQSSFCFFVPCGPCFFVPSNSPPAKAQCPAT